MAAGLELMFRKARSAEKRGDEAEARRLLEEVLASYPKNATARQALARLGDATRMAPTQAEIGLLVAAHRRGDQAETVRLGDALTARFPTIDGVRTLTGAARLKLHDFAGAELDFRLEIQTEPHETGHHNHLGVALMGLGRLDEAETALAEALALDPDNIDALLNMALLYEGRGKYDEATEFCETVLRIKPGHLRGLQKLAEVQVVTKQFNPAIATYFKVLADDPEHGGALHGIGRALMALNRHEQAVDSLRLAARVDPDSFDIHSDLGQALSSLGRFEQAIVAFATAAGICPDHYAVWGRLLALQAYLCDWTSRDALSTLPIDTAHMGIPFDALTFEDEPVRQLRRAEVYARHHFPDCYAPFVAPVRKPGGRIRIGYLSADFYNHATIFLMAGLFREHDRSRFEIRCYDFSPNGAATSVLDDHVDAMIDIRGMSDREAIDRIRADELDIAIDLKGYTRDSRAHILAARVAPLQVSYLGYPGSVGMEAMDYILADPVVIPHGFEDGYSEKILRLPGSYQPNDDQRTISATNDDRKSLGLPETGFVFCCFNQGYKIGPREFDLWMPLLQAVEGSVLWLISSNDKADANLKKEAAARGIDPDRLVFAQKRSHADHLARQRFADLFLDTFHYNAHTTASDAMWGGLPVLTRPGRQFSARVGASLVTAMDMPEMIADTDQAYFDKALELARSPEMLAAIRAKLAANRAAAPLFDTVRYARAIEAAYTAIHERRMQGLAPADIDIG